MEQKPSLLRYFLGELRWAAHTTRAWIRLLIKDRRAAFHDLREGLGSEDFRARAQLWSKATAFTYGRLHASAPLLIGLATGLYCGLTQTPIAWA